MSHRNLQEHAVMSRTTDAMIPPPRERADVRGGKKGPWRLSLVQVPSGVAAGRTRRVQGNAHTESWALFMTREQLDACLTTDPLRHADPLLFAQIKREFDHVFDSPSSYDSRDLNSGVREELGLCRTSA
jgi:hypothetical protein